MKRTLAALLMAAMCVVLPRIGTADDATIRLTTIPLDPAAEPYYAQEMGFFKKAGLDVDVQTGGNGAAIVAGVVSGSIDIGFSNILSITIAFAKNIPITVVAAAGYSNAKSPLGFCVVPKDSPIKTAKDLNGATFGVGTLRSIGELGPRAWIDKNGGDSSTVKFVEIPFTTLAAALAEHRVAAEVVSEPYISDALNVGRSIGNCFDAVAPRFLVGAFFASTAWANAHPDQVRKFAAAMHETALWANANRDKTAALYARQSHVDTNIVRSMYRSPYAEQLEASDIQPVIDLSAHYGIIPAKFPAGQMIFHEPR
jgi:ABC-type nitrate/sulfonate/bicarbonate transport system substrate-binding protein